MRAAVGWLPAAKAFPSSWPAPSSGSGSGYQIAVRAVAADKPEPISDRRRSDRVGQGTGAGRGREKSRRTCVRHLATRRHRQRQAETFTASSLDAVRAYTIAQDLTFEPEGRGGGRRHYRDALRTMPSSGAPIRASAASLLRLGRPEEAQKNVGRGAASHRSDDGAREAAHYGVYYSGSRGIPTRRSRPTRSSIDKYPADSAGYNNLARSPISAS